MDSDSIFGWNGNSVSGPDAVFISKIERYRYNLEKRYIGVLAFWNRDDSLPYKTIHSNSTDSNCDIGSMEKFYIVEKDSNLQRENKIWILYKRGEK